MGGAAGACCGEGGATACGVACGAGPASMNYVGCGQGDYAQETTYRYIGNGGDFVQGRPRDFTCIITGCGLLAVLLLIPLLLWLLLPCTTTRHTWTTYNPTNIITVQTTPMPTPCTSVPVPTPCPPGPPPGPVDPWNCAVDPEWKWCAGKKAWCCRIHHLGCPTNTPTLPPPVPDPYNCEDGFANWQAGWSVAKKAWCCRHHSKGCPGGGGCGTTKPPYDCNAGFWNWQHG